MKKNNKLILVVEDDEDILFAIQLVLEDASYDVRVLPNAKKVFREITAFQPSLIILDMLLSGNDGRKICKEIKQDKTMNSMPVLLISAHPSAREDAEKIHADGFLAKPFTTKDLLTSVAKLV